MKRNRMPILTMASAAVLLAASALAQPLKNETKQPKVSGVEQGNVGCAVLEKHMPVKGALLALGVIYARTEYRVLATYNATLPREKFTGPGEVKELNHLALKDKIKLVIIHSGYSDAELKQAKQMCHEPGLPAPDASPSSLP